MPLSIPATNATKANFADTLKAFVDGLETSVGTAQSTANAANTLAGQKYTLPVSGIPASTLAAAVLDGLRYSCEWNGSAYVTPAGTVVTATRVANTRRDFLGPSDPFTLGLAVNGDSWESTA